MRWLPLILICLLIYIEAVIFVHVASAIGVFMTLVLVVLTSCLGVSLVRNQGMRNLSLIQQKIQAGESPAAEMIKSVSLVLAGILLVLRAFHRFLRAAVAAAAGTETAGVPCAAVYPRVSAADEPVRR